MPLAPSTNNHGPPLAPRLATHTISSSSSQISNGARGPRLAPRIVRNDSFASAPSDGPYSPITSSSGFNSHPSRRAPAPIIGTLRNGDGVGSRSSTPNSTASGASSPMFFHASDAKNLRPAKALSKPPISSAKFFYASDTRNGSTSRSHSPVRDPQPSITSPPLGQFPTPAAKPTPRLAPSAVSAPSKPVPHVKYNDTPSATPKRRDRSPDTRPVSPLYDSSSGSQASAATRLITSPMLSTSPPKPSFLSHAPPHIPSQPPSQRNSYGSAQSPLPLQLQGQPQSRRQSVDLTPRRPARASSVSGYGDMPNGYDHHDVRQSPKSPVTATVPLHAISNAAAMIEHQKELAAAARRERKILDLEISNASLLAINKTFERRIRKQTAEIRRFRRLSRAGLLSSDKFAAKQKRRGSKEYSESETGQEDDASGEEESDEYSLGEEEEEEDFDDDDESSSSGDNASSSAEKEAKDQKRRETDENHLATDIARHRALLEASAKMNSSLKRCHLLTETLIEDAKKALETVVERPVEPKRVPRVVGRANDDDDVTESELDTEYEGHDNFQDITDDESRISDSEAGDRSGYSTPTYFQGSERSGPRSASEYESRSEYGESMSSEGYYSEDYESQDGSTGVPGVYDIDAPDILTPRVEEREYPVLRLAKAFS
ncbi:hypothetical protein ABW19_dt0200799 [Dactylella cylindrospora]|nr:hypothetical protein ABW19_dt0200799 [Dactylella cylindrospora]